MAKLKRVNILISPQQHEDILRQKLSLSGLVRDLLHDRLSGNTITVSVPETTRKLYDQIISNFGISDDALAPYMLQALEKYLIDKTKKIEQLRKTIDNYKKSKKDTESMEED